MVPPVQQDSNISPKLMKFPRGNLPFKWKLEDWRSITEKVQEKINEGMTHQKQVLRGRTAIVAVVVKVMYIFVCF